MNTIFPYLVQYFNIIWQLFTDIEVPLLNVSVGVFLIGLFMVSGLLFGIIDVLKGGFDRLDEKVRQG